MPGKPMARINVPVTWLYGSFDKWMIPEEIRDVMSVASPSDRELIEIPTAHNSAPAKMRYPHSSSYPTPSSGVWPENRFPLWRPTKQSFWNCSPRNVNGLLRRKNWTHKATGRVIWLEREKEKRDMTSSVVSGNFVNLLTSRCPCLIRNRVNPSPTSGAVRG